MSSVLTDKKQVKQLAFQAIVFSNDSYISDRVASDLCIGVYGKFIKWESKTRLLPEKVRINNFQL